MTEEQLQLKRLWCAHQAKRLCCDDWGKQYWQRVINHLMRNKTVH